VAGGQNEAIAIEPSRGRSGVVHERMAGRNRADLGGVPRRSRPRWPEEQACTASISEATQRAYGARRP
jgi:hypothetical protein